MVRGQVVEVLPNILEFHYHYNFGAAGGILQGQNILFFVVTILALLMFGWFFSRINFETKKSYSLAICLLIGGTLGNAVDRMIRLHEPGFFAGGVVDMIRLPFVEYLGLGGYIFNLADVALMFGIILFAIEVLFLERKRSKRIIYVN
jgi:signal peptidase II